MSKNDNLKAAKTVKNDEFYTQRCDIENELQYYTQHFQDKTIYCNCDDPEKSEFWKFFEQNFHNLGLKKLIATGYTPGKNCTAWILESNQKLTKINLPCDGDFQSEPCVKLMQQTDIIVTNPPFSLFRKYIDLLMRHQKQFLIIGSMNAITYKEFFPLLQTNQVWLGYTHPKKFIQPDGSLKAFGNILWYTNLDIQKRHIPLDLHGNQYQNNESKYPVYANYNAIECSKINQIPSDYFGLIGVPITFLEKYCPSQFEIIGISRQLGTPMSKIAPKGTYEPGGIRFYLEQPGQALQYKRLYDRIIIRRK